MFFFHHFTILLHALGKTLIFATDEPIKQRKYLPQFDFAQQEQQTEQESELPEAEIIRKYKWSAKNIRIAVAGSQRRSGVTVTAFNLAAWLTARGAEVCYVEMNMNRHLQMILNTFEAPRDGEHYTVDGIDCYLTNELDRDYHFIIYDCGVMTTSTSCFKSQTSVCFAEVYCPMSHPNFTVH